MGRPATSDTPRPGVEASGRRRGAVRSGRALQVVGVCSAAAAFVLFFAPQSRATADATPSATVSPNVGLTDGQAGITIRASGFPGRVGFIQVEECEGTLAQPPRSNRSCDGATLDSQAGTDPSGNYLNELGDAAGDTGYTAYLLPSSKLHTPSPIHCDSAHACVLYIGVNQNDFSKPHVFAPVTFAGVAAPPPTTAPQATAVHRPTTVVPSPGASPDPATVSAATASPTAGAAGNGTASLAFTGMPPQTARLAIAGLGALLVGTIVLRRALRPARPRS